MNYASHFYTSRSIPQRPNFHTGHLTGTQILVNGLLYLGRGSGRCIPLDDVPALVHQKLGEIPLDAVAQQPAAPLLRLEVLVERRLLGAVHVDLVEDGVLRLEPRARELLDLLVGPGLLAPELVAGERQDFELAALELGVEVGELLVVGGRQAALGRHVHNQQHLAPVLAQLHVVAVDVLDREVVHGAHGEKNCPNGTEKLDWK